MGSVCLASSIRPLLFPSAAGPKFTNLAVRTEKKCWILLSGQLINATEHAFHFGNESRKRYSDAAKIGTINYLPIAQNNAGRLFDKYGPKSQQQLRSSAPRSSQPCSFGSLGTRLTCHERRGNHRAWLPQGSRLAPRLRRPRRSFQHAMADRCRREGQGPLGSQGVRPLGVPPSAVGGLLPGALSAQEFRVKRPKFYASATVL